MAKRAFKVTNITASLQYEITHNMNLISLEFRTIGVDDNVVYIFDVLELRPTNNMVQQVGPQQFSFSILDGVFVIKDPDSMVGWKVKNG